MIEAALYNKLTTTPEITAQVGANVYPSYVPTNPFPRIIFTVDSLDPINTHDGFSGLLCAHVTIAAMTRTKTATTQLAELVKRYFMDQKGTWAGIKIQLCRYKSQEEIDLTPADLGAMGNAILINIHFEIWFEN